MKFTINVSPLFLAPMVLFGLIGGLVGGVISFANRPRANLFFQPSTADILVSVVVSVMAGMIVGIVIGLGVGLLLKVTGVELPQSTTLPATPPPQQPERQPPKQIIL